ncbi:Ribosome quality control complex subunit 2 like protein [Verticillium longisporum]|nr:Ribosome quality control complex subunit 2 like protein [Verticillium longisporum]
MFPHQQQSSSPDQPLPSPTVDNILDVFLLIRGMSEILDASELLIRRGTLGHLFAQETAPPTSTPLLDSVAARLMTFNAAIDPTNVVVARELEGLISWIHRATATTALPENRIALTWPIDLSGDYISLLRQRDPAALSLLAYYCVIAHELHESLVTLRLANVYDLSSKILLLKFAKPDNKKQILIDSGFRCHLTDFARTTAAAPSAFVARLRKFLKTRRLTAVSQVGTDRIIEFTFSDGQYRLFLEFFASGNVILTDAELRILTLLRNVPEGEGQEPQRVGLSYSLDNRQNFGGVPPLTRERLQDALRVMAAKAANAPTTGKKKVKPGDQLRKGLATTITELPPMLVDHAFQVTGFDPTKTPAELLDSDALLDSLLHALTVARKVVEDATSSATTTGYVIAKYRQKSEETEEKPDDGAETKREDLLYDDFHPFLPQKFVDDPFVKVLTFDGFNKTVDEFFSSLEGQKLESKLTEREAAAKKKLEATRQDHAQRIEGLQEAQSLNEQKAAAIEANVERVQEAMDAVNGLVQQGMDWVNIGKLIEREQKRHNPVAETIKLPLKLGENLMTLLLGTEAVEDEDEAYETGSDASDSEDDEDGAKAKGADRRLQIEINLGLSPWANAREYYDQRRTAAVKEQKTVQHSTMALKNAEKKIMEDLKKGLKQEKAVLQPIRKQMWFEKFIWFISSDGYLVLGGKDAQQNETLYKRYLRKGDIYCHADMHGAATVIVKNKQDTPDAPIPPSTLAQAGMLDDADVGRGEMEMTDTIT